MCLKECMAYISSADKSQKIDTLPILHSM